MEALDKINDRYGEFTILPASIVGLENTTLNRIAFSGVKDMERQ